MLWSRARLVGVVDWVSGGIGPADSDVGHALLNLAVLFSAEWADRFRTAYEAAAGRRVDPWWEARELLKYGPSWRSFIPIQVGRRAPVDVDGMHDRVDELAAAVLKRLT